MTVRPTRCDRLIATYALLVHGPLAGLPGIAVRNVFLLMLVVTSIGAPNLSAAAEANIANKVTGVYVARRPLDRQPLNGIGAFSHSALLLETDDGACYVLEYHRDSRAHLTPVQQTVIAENSKKGVAFVRMAGRASGKTSVFVWERQLIGDPIAADWTPQDLQARMQQAMQGYSVLKQEHCHTAVKRLRADLGLLPHSPSKASKSVAR